MTASSFRISPAALLDLLGFARQLVFATFSEGLAFSLGRPIEARFGASLAGCDDAAQAQF